MVALAACAAALVVVAPKAKAQNFQPPSQDEIRQMMMDKIRDRLSITNDDEWRAIEPKITKAMDAARDVLAMRDMSTIMPDFRAMMRRRNGENGDDNNGGNGDRAERRRNRRRGGGFGMFGGEPSPSVAALEQALENNAPKSEIKTKMEAVEAELKDKEAKLAAARDDLRSVLTTRQEATLVVSGILN